MDIELYAFEYFHPLRKRWIRARYKATREVIAQRHAPGNWRTVGRPEIRAAGIEDPLANNFGASPAAPPGGA